MRQCFESDVDFAKINVWSFCEKQLNMMNANLIFFYGKIIIFNTTKTILLRSNEFSKHNGRFESYFQTEFVIYAAN